MKKVLICDDEGEFLNIIKEVISSKFTDDEIDVAYSKNGMDALVKTSNNVYDLIITDHKMPIMSGGDFVNNMRSIRPSKNRETPVMVISGFLPEMMEEQEHFSNTLFMAKPLNYNQFLSNLDFVINQAPV